MTRIFLFFLLSFLANVEVLNAQGGYLGRKTAVYIHGDITSYQRFSFYARPWNKCLGLSIARTVNRNLEVSVGGQYSVGARYPYSVGGRQHSSRTEMEHNNLVGYGGKVGFRRFRYTTGSISPIGTYWGMDFTLDYYKVNDSFRFLESGEFILRDYELKYIKAQFWFKVGWQTILGEHFLVGGEVKTGVIPIVAELTNTNSYGFWVDDKSSPIVDEFIDYRSGLIVFEFGRNLLVPQIQVAYLF